MFSQNSAFHYAPNWSERTSAPILPGVSNFASKHWMTHCGTLWLFRPSGGPLNCHLSPMTDLSMASRPLACRGVIRRAARLQRMRPLSRLGNVR